MRIGMYMDLWVPAQHGLQHIGQKIRGQPLDAGQSDLSALDALQLGQLDRRPLLILEYGDDVLGEYLARLRQAQPAWQAVEQRQASLLLQVQQLAIDGRSIDVQLPRRRPDRSGPAYRVEVPNGLGVNAHTPPLHGRSVDDHYDCSLFIISYTV